MRPYMVLAIEPGLTLSLWLQDSFYCMKFLRKMCKEKKRGSMFSRENMGLLSRSSKQSYIEANKQDLYFVLGRTWARRASQNIFTDQFFKLISLLGGGSKTFGLHLAVLGL